MVTDNESPPAPGDDRFDDGEWEDWYTLTPLERLLREEEDRERETDRQYWAPLRSRLEALRREHHDRR